LYDVVASYNQSTSAPIARFSSSNKHQHRDPPVHAASHFAPAPLHTWLAD
jgi:hypothetical protein